MIQGSVAGGYARLAQLSKAGTTTITVPTGFVYWLYWLDIRYVASADVASRAVNIYLTRTDTNNVILQTYTVTASQTKHATYGLASGNVTLSGDNKDSGAGNPIPLYAGQKISIVIGSEQAADAWTGEGVYFVQPLAVA